MIYSRMSQVTIFLILGAVIVVIISIIVIMNNYSVRKELSQEVINAKENVFDTQPIKNFVQECLSIVSKDSLESFNEPSARDLEGYVKNNIDPCLDLSVFEEQGFQISKEQVSIEVDINENDTSFRMEYPMIIISPARETKTILNEFFVVQVR